MKNSLIKYIFLMMTFLSLLPLDGKTREIEEVFKSMSSLEDPFSLRDPFQPPKIKRIKESKVNTQKKDGVYTNIPQLGQVNLNEIQITGVVIGPNRRAFLKKDGGQVVYTIKEGMKLGPNNAEIKAILPGGIILVERVTNIYGEEEFLETVIPLSK